MKNLPHLLVSFLILSRNLGAVNFLEMCQVFGFFLFFFSDNFLKSSLIQIDLITLLSQRMPRKTQRCHLCNRLAYCKILMNTICLSWQFHNFLTISTIIWTFIHASVLLNYLVFVSVLIFCSRKLGCHKGVVMLSWALTIPGRGEWLSWDHPY